MAYVTYPNYQQRLHGSTSPFSPSEFHTATQCLQEQEDLLNWLLSQLIELRDAVSSCYFCGSANLKSELGILIDELVVRSGSIHGFLKPAVGSRSIQQVYY